MGLITPHDDKYSRCCRCGTFREGVVPSGRQMWDVCSYVNNDHEVGLEEED
jgi:hypothetical protein